MADQARPGEALYREAPAEGKERRELAVALTAPSRETVNPLRPRPSVTRLELDGTAWLPGSPVMLPRTATRLTEPRRVADLRGALGDALRRDHPALVPDGAGLYTVEPDGYEPRFTSVALAAALQFQRDHGARALLVVGHAGAVEPSPAALSLGRATSALALLTGDRAAWVAQAESAARRADVAGELLRHVALTRGWPCAPVARGAPLLGDARALDPALRAFAACHDRELGGTLEATLGPAMWGAWFDLLSREIAERLELELAGLDELRARARGHAPIAAGAGAQLARAADRPAPRVELFFARTAVPGGEAFAPEGGLAAGPSAGREASPLHGGGCQIAELGVRPWAARAIVPERYLRTVGTASVPLPHALGDRSAPPPPLRFVR